MKRQLPDMTDRPSKGVPICIFVYWIFCFVLMPFTIPVLSMGVWENLNMMSWLEIIYHSINGLVLVGIMKSYLKESFFQVEMDPWGFAKTVAVTCGCMIGVVLLENLGWSQLLPRWQVVANSFPLVQMEVSMSAGYLVQQNPVFGSLCLTLITPFTLSGLFYASGFAPVGCNRPRVAYLVVSILLFLPCAFDILWRDNAVFVIIQYCLRLPIHLLACRAYQKTNTIWAPVISLGVLNGTCCVFSLLG